MGGDREGARMKVAARVGERGTDCDETRETPMYIEGEAEAAADGQTWGQLSFF